MYFIVAMVSIALILLIIIGIKYRNTSVERGYTKKGFTKNANATRAFLDGHDIASTIYHSAIQRFDKAIEVNDEYVDAYYGRGSSYLGLYRMGLASSIHAEQDFDKALELDPKNDLVYAAKGNLYAIQGDRRKAIESFTKALEINPNNKETEKGLAMAQAIQ